MTELFQRHIPTPRRLTDVDNWHEHIPFAFLCIELLGPRIFVELGVHRGDSYCAFCQAVDELHTPTTCYGVDTWLGDAHAGFYEGDAALADLRAHHDPLYGRFSRLVRSTFDEAREYFADGSIDLLHVDGLHTYESVRHDVETWQPKLSERAVVLLHDVNVRENQFGVWKFWEELRVGRPSLTFAHSHGLGVVAIGSDVPPPFLDFLRRAGEPRSPIPGLLFALGNRVALIGRARRLETELAEARARSGTAQTELAQLRRELAERQAELETELGRLRPQLAAQDAELDGLRGRVAQDETELARLRPQLAAREAELDVVRARLAEREDEVARLRPQLAAREAALEELRPQLAHQRAELDRVPPLFTQCQAELERVRTQLGQYEADLVRLKGQMGALSTGAPTLRATHVMSLEGTGNVVWQNGRYRSIGGPTRFRLISPVGRAPRGWVVTRFRASSDRGPLALRLLAELADQSSVAHLLPVSRGEVVSAAVRLPDEVASLSLEPADSVDAYTIEGFTVREISRVEALARVAWPRLRPLLRQPGGLPALARRTFAVWREEGLPGLKRRLAFGPGPVVYSGTGASGGPIASGADQPASRVSVPSALTHRPLISIVMPVYNADPRYLRSAVRSVERQTYTNWQLCVADDGSSNPATLLALQEIATGDRKITVTRERHGGISAATNAALRLAQGAYVAFLDHDDELAPEALLEYVVALNENPDLDILYSDEDKIDAAGTASDPFFKPDWSPELLRGVMYVGHLLMVRRSLVEAVGGCDSAYDGVQDFELMLRLSERTDRIHHARRILYHWRRIPGSVAFAVDAKSHVGERQAAAVNAHLRRIGVPAIAKPHPILPHRVIVGPEPRSKPWPPVSIVIPTKNAAAYIGRCLDSLFSLTTYPTFEVIVVDNGTTDAAAKVVLGKHPVTVVPFDEPFSFSRANNVGVDRARGDYLVLLNNDTEVLDPEWLQTLVFHLELPSVAVVGPLLVYPDGSVQHAGVALGLRGTADHVMRGFPADGDGYAGSLCCTREVEAVTGACLGTSRQHYLRLGGLNEFYGTHYQDVDFCLRTRRAGLRVLFTPRTKLVHHESASRGSFYDHLDRALLLDAWGELIARGDPFHDPRVSGYSR
jgi:glycosyltransferase involved in cell wall biosynthesis/uncharacterized coiled-coil protein SlyX